MSPADLSRWRLAAQRLEGAPEADATAVVGRMLAFQAENPSQVAWAVGTRCGAVDEEAVLGALDDGAFLRTHALRLTWHYVCPADLGWLLDLTRPRVLPSYDRQLRTAGIEGRRRTRLLDLVAAAVAGGPLTRIELGERLAEQGERLTGFGLMVLAAAAEVEALVCSGPRAAGEHTYAAYADRVVAGRDLAGDEALAELAVRYLTGHGPATDRDLAYWSHQSLTVARQALASAGGALATVEVAGRTYWHFAGDGPPPAAQPRAHLLQILDEYYRGYQDSRDLLDLADLQARGPERFVGMAIVGSQILGEMRRSVTAATARFEVRPWRTPHPGELDLLEDAAGRYAAFLGRRPDLVVVD